MSRSIALFVAGLVTAWALSATWSIRRAEAGVTGACCLPGGQCLEGQTFEECASAGGSYQGDGTLCGEALCGACCLPGDACVDGIAQGSCEGSFGGDFQGGGSACVDIECGACPSDVTGDGIVGINDFLQVLVDWGPCAE